MKKIQLVTICAFAVSLLAVGMAFAQSDELSQSDDLSKGQERILGGHTFLPSLYVGEPWISTSFRNHTGGGVAVGLKTPFNGLDGNELFILDGDIFYTSLSMGLQQQLGSSFAPRSGIFRQGAQRYQPPVPGGRRGQR